MGSKEIESILQRLRRSSSDALYQPPNQAQVRLGRRLGICFREKVQEDLAREIVEILKTTNPSVPHAFFHALQQQQQQQHHHPNEISVSLISSWITQAHEHASLLEAILGFYVRHCRQHLQNVDGDRISNTYLQLPPEMRPAFATLMAQSEPCRALLSPIMAVSVLNTSISLSERTMVLNTILHSCSLSLRQQQLSVDVLSWHVESLILLLESSDSVDPLVNSWLVQLMDMLSVADQDIANLFEAILEHILPRCVGISSIHSILSSAILVSQKTTTAMSDQSLFNLMSVILSTPIQEDCRCLLQVLQQLSCTGQWSVQLKRVMSSMFVVDEVLADVATTLRSTTQMKQRDTQSLTFWLISMEKDDLELSMGLLTDAVQNMGEGIQVPVLTQNSLLLLACGLLLEHESDPVKTFVKSLLQRFPHLGVPLVPVLLDMIQESATDGHTFLQRLEFLCEVVVHDPHCAQEVWSLVASLSRREQPLSIRLAAIRMYSTLCTNNRRLYRRVIDSMGSFVEERQAEIRLAVISVVCRLAEEDQIRDVSDVIGWVQSYLRDEIPAIVHLAIMSLHFMVLNGELDFDLVVKVLGKRLCAVEDLDQVMQLPGMVLEALVILLGDGEVEGDDSESDNSDGISLQVSNSVQILIELAESDFFSKVNYETGTRVRFNIFQSLSKYSLEALGVDEAGIRAMTDVKTETNEASTPDMALRYASLCHLITDAFSNSVFNDDEIAPVVALAQKVMHCEEEILGTTVWQKGHKNLSDTKKIQKVKPSKSALSALPKPEHIYKSYDSDPSASTATACLLCFDGKDVDRLGDFAGDLSNETSSPQLRLLIFQGWMHAMSRVWSNLSNRMSAAEEVVELIDDIRGWRETVGDADYAYLALSAFTLYVPNVFSLPDGSSIDLGPIVDSVLQDIEQAFKRHQFTDLDVGYLCFAFAGVRSLRSGSSLLFDQVLSALTNEANEISGAAGLFFGLSFMAQYIPTGATHAHSMIAVDRHQRQIWVGQIAAFLINELQLCFVKSSQSVVTLIACLRIASPSPNLTENLKALIPLCIQESSKMKAKVIMMCLGSCIQSLIGIHPELFQAVVHLLLTMPRGSGSEYALSSILTNSASSGILNESDLELVQAFAIQECDETHNFSLYLSAALNATESESQEWLQQKGEWLKVDDNMLSLVSLVGSLPILATNEESALASAKLLPHTTSKTIAMVLELIGSTMSEVATMVKGLLCSMSLPPISIPDAVSPSSSPGTMGRLQLSLDAKKLPTPNDKTILYQIVSFIRSELLLIKSNVKANITRLSYLLISLIPLSLPGQFATDLIGPLIFESDHAELRLASLRLLLSQFMGRRRATMEGRDFVNLAARVMTSSESLVSRQGDIFYSGMSDLIRKSSTDLAESIVSQSWHNCLSGLQHGEGVVNARRWLESMKPILKDINTNHALALSPRTSSLIQLFISTDVFSSLAAIAQTHYVDDVFDILITCLGEIPVSILDDRGFFDFDKKMDIVHLLWKARCVSALAAVGHVETEQSRKIISLFAWFSKQTLDDKVTATTVRRAAIVIGTTFSTLEDSTQNQIVQLLLEAMLVNGHESVAFELLALSVNQVAPIRTNSVLPLALKGVSTLPELSNSALIQVWDSVLQESPRNLSAYAAKSRTERVISNRIVQVYNGWKDSGAPQKMLDLLLRILNATKSNDATEKDIFAIISSKLSVSK